ncbi:uncharacterized protein [Musca autumnalis]|uniref:uncharacterized protein n=1 Tax=Musca autumnalis TaxID=221902 RepID=UPI003CF9CFF5
MKILILICFVLCGILNVYATETTNTANKITTTKQITDDTTAAVAGTATVAKESSTTTNDATKDKRQTKDTKDGNNVYANHRTDGISSSGSSGNSRSSTNSDDPEDPQETIYGTDGRQFLIRPQSQSLQQQQSDEEQQQQQQEQQEHQPRHQQLTQLRNYPVTIRPHSSQLLEQSQEIQHYAYLQDINRQQQQQHKSHNQGKSRAGQNKKSAARSHQSESSANSQVEEAEQRYSVAVEQPVPATHLQPRGQIYRPQIPYQVALQQQPNGGAANHQQYQIIPEEQFLKLLEEELQARAYHEDQVRRQQQQQQHHQQQHAQAHAQAHAQQAAAQKSTQHSHGLGHYRQRIETTDDEQQLQPEYVQYQTPRSRGGPKYLPLPQNPIQEQQNQQQQLLEQEAAGPPQHPVPPSLPPQIAYYRPQINYKTLANHPLAKSSLEKEIENLFASNKPHVAPVQIVDNSNEPSVLINHHHHRHTITPSPPAPAPTVQTHSPRTISAKAYVPSTSAPNSLTDVNSQPFVPSLFRLGNYPQPVGNYPQHVIDAKKLGPVVYPPSSQPPVQASQFYYQEALPSPRPKAVRHKYGTKFSTTPTPVKTHQNEVNYPAPSKYAQPIQYEAERPSPSTAPAEPTHFYPSPPDPHRNIHSPPTAPPTPAVTTKYSHQAATDVRQLPLPASSPSQSSIYVSQGTGIATPSRPVKQKTIEDLKQLHLPPPGGKPLTQAEFQALVDAGYPVTAVPVPVPVPYEQYVKDHPEYRNQPPPQPPALPVNYEQLMRFAQLQQHQGPHAQYIAAQRAHPRSLLARPSEPSVRIISSPSEPQAQSVSAIGGGSVTYLRAIPENSKRRPRDESDTKVLGENEDAEKNPVADSPQEKIETLN